MPDNVIESLARLHARYHDGADVPEVVPRVTGTWWQRLCRHWVDPQLPPAVADHPAAVIARARGLVAHAAAHPAVPATLDRLTPTLIHGDVHRGNVLVAGQVATLIDWGSSRVGPAALDLANLVDAGSSAVARYAHTWQRLTGQPLPAHSIELGYRWGRCRSPCSTCPGQSGTGPPATCRPRWTASNRHCTGSPQRDPRPASPRPRRTGLDREQAPKVRCG